MSCEGHGSCTERRISSFCSTQLCRPFGTHNWLNVAVAPYTCNDGSIVEKRVSAMVSFVSETASHKEDFSDLAVGRYIKRPVCKIVLQRMYIVTVRSPSSHAICHLQFAAYNSRDILLKATLVPRRQSLLLSCKHQSNCRLLKTLLNYMEAAKMDTCKNIVQGTQGRSNGRQKIRPPGNPCGHPHDMMMFMQFSRTRSFNFFFSVKYTTATRLHNHGDCLRSHRFFQQWLAARYNET